MLLKNLYLRVKNLCRQLKRRCMPLKHKYMLLELRCILLEHRYMQLMDLYLRKIEWIKTKYLNFTIAFYQILFNRLPSKKEMEVLVNFKKSGGKIEQILQDLIDSVEFENLYLLKYINKQPKRCINEGYKFHLSQHTLLGDPFLIWDKPLLVFFHIKKTGGMTIHNWLSQYFHPLQICPERHNNINRFSTKELLTYKFIGAHISYDQYMNLPHKQKRLVTVLREPKKRIYSHYHFCKAHSLEGLKSLSIKNIDDFVLAKSLTFQEFLQTKGSLQNVYDNVYLRCLTDSWVVDSIDPLQVNPEVLLELAKQRLDSFCAVGILEEFKKTVDLFSSTLDLDPIKCQDIETINVLRDMQKDPNNLIFEDFEQQKIDGDEINTLLVKNTQYDRILYEYGKKLFEKQYNDCVVKKLQESKDSLIHKLLL